MKLRRVLPVALALLILFPTLAQEEEGEGYFSLASNLTFAPGETPSVQFWGWGIPRVEFRLYKVKDAVRFFEQLEDHHRFGGRPPRDARHLTALEKIHRWKTRTRLRIRNIVRQQFDSAAREQVRMILNPPKPEVKRSSAPRVVEFAAVPLLNPQQLVRKWAIPVSARDRWDSRNVELPAPGKGVYLLEATDGRLQAYTIVMVSELALLTKSAPGKLQMRLVRRDTGEAQPGAQFRVFSSREKAVLAELTGDANGFAETSIDEPDPENILVTATYGDDFNAVSLYGSSLSADPARSIRGYVYTDRPIYRPGDKVRYRGVFRAKDLQGWRLPETGGVRIQVQDTEGKPVHRATVRFSRFGTVHGEFTLAKDAALGYYSIQMETGESFSSAGFEVEEYRKPEYEVRVRPVERRVVQGNTIDVRIEARYFFGEPVTNARLTYVVHKSRYWTPHEEEEDGGTDAETDESRYWDKEQVLEEKTEIGPSGEVVVKIATRPAEHDEIYRIEARVTDEAGREISGSAAVVATVGSYFVRIRPERYVYEPGERAVLLVETRDYDNQPVAGRPFVVELRHYQWDRKDYPLLEQTTGKTDSQGSARLEMSVPDGSFLARVTSISAEGRRVEHSAQVWVAGGASWYSRGAESFQIVTDKKSYRPGEMAKVLLAGAPKEADLWVNIEGRGVYATQFVRAKETTVSLEIPIRREFVPNFYVQVVSIREGKMIYGSRSVRVPADEQRLEVLLRATRNEFRPGDSGSYLLQVRDAGGRPVQGEFSIAIVDEALYALRPDRTPDVVSFFFGRDYNHVSTDSSLSFYFHGEAGRRRIQLARIRPFQSRAQLKPERLVQPRVRRDFPDTMFWAADVVTDATGRAKVDVRFPDALTTWRATARGVTADTKVGSALERTLVRKNLMVRLGAPRFFTEGDEVTVAVLAQNYLSSAKTVRLSLETKGAEIIEGRTEDVDVPSRGTVSVPFRVRATGQGEATFLVQGLSDEESDALEISIPIVPFGAPLSEAKSGALTQREDGAEVELSFPEDATGSGRAIGIGATPSVAGAIFGALEYLVSFPYGCTEQTMSSLLPNVLVSQAVKSLGLQWPVKEEELERKIRAGLERLYDFQHDDGGWGWWRTDDSSAFMTAYVVSGLGQAALAGQRIDQSVAQRGAEWLKKNTTRGLSPDLRAYMAYAAAQAREADGQYLNDVWGLRGEMSSYGLALLGLALSEAGDRRAAQLAEQLEQRARQDESEAFWAADFDGLLHIETDASPEATAYAVKLLSRLRPNSPLLPKAALYLVRSRNRGYYWNSTKQTAMVIYGLLDYLRQSGELKPDLRLTVEVNGREVFSKRLTAEDAVSIHPLEVRVDGSQLAAGGNKIRIRKSGEGRLYWSAQARYFSISPRQMPRTGAGLGLKREYFRLVAQRQGSRIVHNLEPLSGLVRQGDVLAVRLTLSGGEWRYLHVEDPIPAGAEFIEREDLYELREKPPWWRYWFSRRELRDNRAVFFQTWFDRSEQQYFYLLKVTNVGRFRINPARVQPMYQPQYLASTEHMELTVVGGSQE
jgi:uncharacterized protein YfaS (alpha-2-macroglobulin family)